MRETTGFRQRRRVLGWLAALTGGLGLHACGGGGDAPSAGEDRAAALATPDGDGCAGDDANRSVVRYRLTDLGATPGFPTSNGHALNARGHATDQAAEHAFRYADGAMQDLGTLGGNASGGRAINVHGHVAGWADTSAPRTHAFLYSGGLMKDLDVFDGPFSEAHGINSSDWVVGRAVFPGHRDAHGFVHDGTTLRDLNDLTVDGGRWEVTEALDINDAGEIMASARTRGGTVAHSVLLTPLRGC